MYRLLKKYPFLTFLIIYMLLSLRGLFPLCAQKPFNNEKEKAVKESIARLQHKESQALTKIDEVQKHLSHMEASLESLLSQEAIKMVHLKEKQENNRQIFLSLLRLVRQPWISHVLNTNDPNELVRSVIIFKTFIPQIQQKISHVKQELLELTELKTTIVKEKEKLKERHEELSEKHTQLQKLLEHKLRVLAQLNEAHSPLPTLSHPSSIKELIKTINRSKIHSSSPLGNWREEKQDETKPFSLILPASGRIINTYNDSRFNPFEKGCLILTTQKEQHISSPHDGTVVFKGPFRGYGNIIIIDSHKNYYTLLSGLGTIKVTTGQAVKTGEVIGEVALNKLGESKVYLELWQNNQVVNPFPLIRK